MLKLIDKEELIFEYYRNPTYANLCKVINDAPIIDAEPVRHGHWIDTTDEPYGEAFRPFICSCCRNSACEDTDFCPNCGAKMDGGVDGTMAE